MINHMKIHAVTGAFGYSGKYITERLLAEGKPVITLTNSFQRMNPFGDRLGQGACKHIGASLHK